MTGVESLGGWPVLLGKVAGGQSLTRHEAESALTDILAGVATPAQIAGLIVALRIKGESAEEMTGLATAMMGAAEPLQVPANAIDIVGTGGSPHRRQGALNISTMACIVAAAAGATVCKHGNLRASSTSGSFDFLEALGVDIGLTPTELEAMVADVGVGFAFARAYHPAMRHVGPVRTELGIPTVFNVLGPLANPGRVRRQVIGTAEVGLARTMAQVTQNLGSEHAWLVSGHQGLDELSLTGPSTVFEVKPAGITEFQVTPEEVGLGSIDSLDALTGGSAEDNVAVFHAIVDGSEHGPRRDVVVLNAGAGLVVAGLVPDLEAGVTRAGAAIDDGRAKEKLTQATAVRGAPS